MIVFTARMIYEEHLMAGTMCLAQQTVPCHNDECDDDEHTFFCTRSADHPTDLHVAVAIDQADPDQVPVLAGVWSAS